MYAFKRLPGLSDSVVTPQMLHYHGDNHPAVDDCPFLAQAHVVEIVVPVDTFKPAQVLRNGRFLHPVLLFKKPVPAGHVLEGKFLIDVRHLLAEIAAACVYNKV